MIVIKRKKNKLHNASLDIKLPKINPQTKKFDFNYDLKEKLRNNPYENMAEDEDNRVLKDLKIETQQLLKEVKQEFQQQEDNTFESSTPTPEIKSRTKKAKKKDLHLDLEDKAKMMKSIFTIQNDELDFASTSSKISKPSMSRQSRLRKEFSTESQPKTGINHHVYSSSKKIEDPFSKPKDIKVRRIKDYYNNNLNLTDEIGVTR